MLVASRDLLTSVDSEHTAWLVVYANILTTLGQSTETLYHQYSVSSQICLLPALVQ